MMKQAQSVSFVITLFVAVVMIFAMTLDMNAANAQPNNKERFLDIQTLTTPSGIEVWLAEDDTLPIIAMAFTFRNAGAKQDLQDKQGLSILAASTMNESAGPYDNDEFLTLQNNNNISLFFASSRDDFGGTLKMLTRHKDLAFELLDYTINAPRFDEAPLERMRQSNLSRIRASLPNPNWRNARLLNEIVYEGHPYALNSGGTLTTLNNITRDDLLEFTKTRFSRDTLKVSISGDINAEEAIAAIENIFGGLPQTTDLPTIDDITVQNQGKMVLHPKDMPQTLISIVQNGVGRDHPDYYKAMVMNYILGGGGFGSRLTTSIREERGLTYGIRSGLSNMDHIKTLRISTSTKNNAVPEMLGLIREEFETMRNAPVSDLELSDAKAYLIGSMPLKLSSTGAIAGLMLGMQRDGLPVTYLDERAEKIDAITIENIQNVAQTLLNPENFTIVMTGAPEGLEDVTTITELPNVE
jgi:zinc protease